MEVSHGPRGMRKQHCQSTARTKLAPERRFGSGLNPVDCAWPPNVDWSHTPIAHRRPNIAIRPVSGLLSEAHIDLVISNRRPVYGLARAKRSQSGFSEQYVSPQPNQGRTRPQGARRTMWSLHALRSKRDGVAYLLACLRLNAIMRPSTRLDGQA